MPNRFDTITWVWILLVIMTSFGIAGAWLPYHIQLIECAVWTAVLLVGIFIGIILDIV